MPIEPTPEQRAEARKILVRLLPHLTAVENVERIATLIAERDAARAEAQWRPIATAPKDGTRILVARMGEEIGCNGPLEIVEWIVSLRRFYEPVPGTEFFRLVEKPDWNGNGHRATHWMPLPAPPMEPSP